MSRKDNTDKTGISVLLNNPYCADVFFTSFDGKHTLSAHASVINARFLFAAIKQLTINTFTRAPGLLSCPLTRIKTKKDNIEIDLPEDFTFHAMFEILRFVYTGSFSLRFLRN
jgi:hypothetical protein